MTTLKVFVSSTAYDLGVLRSSLKGFIEGLGFEPILSEYSDVLFDPREHTHASCIAEIRNCDVVVLVVGSRFGGEAIPNVIRDLGRGQVDDILSDNEGHKFSVTQAEALTAFDQSIPVFAFVDFGVLHDYRVYSLNPDVKITYPSISQADTAEYIFEFINFLQNRAYGNAVIPFARIEDITGHLRKQWTALFQRLLREGRDRQEESRRIDRLSEQFEDLKTALLATVGDGEARRVARGVVRYRRLLEFIRGFPTSNDLRHYAVEFKGEWSEFLREYVDVVEIKSPPQEPGSFSPYSLMVTSDRAGYMIRFTSMSLARMAKDWNDFKSEPTQLRTVLYDSLSEQDVRTPSLIVRPLTKEDVEEFIAERMNSGREEKPDISTSTESSADQE